MKWFEIAILILVVVYSAYVIFGKKKHGCSGNCGACQGCTHKEKE